MGLWSLCLQTEKLVLISVWKVAAVILICVVLRSRPSPFWRVGPFHWEVWLSLASGMCDLLRKSGAFDEILNSFQGCRENYELERMYFQVEYRLWWENLTGPWLYFKFRGPSLTKTESRKQGMILFFPFSNQEKAKSGGASEIWYKTNWVFSENKTSDHSKNYFLHFLFCHYVRCPQRPPSPPPPCPAPPPETKTCGSSTSCFHCKPHSQGGGGGGGSDAHLSSASCLCPLPPLPSAENVGDACSTRPPLLMG